MINLFPARYLRPAPTAGGNVDSEGSDTDDEDGGDTNDNWEADADALDLYLRKSQHLREAILCEFSDDGVAEMWEVHKFMTFVACSTSGAIPGRTIHHRGLLALI